MWQFDCVGYSSAELYKIFNIQLRKKGWKITDEEQIQRLFDRNCEIFTGYGGDTERLTFFSELEHSKDSFMEPTKLASSPSTTTASVGAVDSSRRESVSLESQRLSGTSREVLGTAKSLGGESVCAGAPLPMGLSGSVEGVDYYTHDVLQPRASVETASSLRDLSRASNTINASQIERGMEKLRENNMDLRKKCASSNPMSRVMSMFKDFPMTS